jgi:hypothetical protein
MIIAINASAKECRGAKIAHELFTINTVIVHLFLTLGLIKLLIGAYVFYFLVTSLALIISTDVLISMDGVSIVDSILSLLGVVPLFFCILVPVVLGSGSMFNAGCGEIDQKLVQKYPQN